MDQTTLKIATAGLFHDIGKLVDRELLDVTPTYINDNTAQYLPMKDGRHTHHHAVDTAAFIEHLKDDLPAELNRPEWGDEDSFVNLAAGHHDPRTPMQWIIAEADRVSSGWDRDTYEGENAKGIAPRDFRKTRLLPIFEQLQRGAERQNPKDFEYAYPLAPMSPETIFPGKRRDVEPADDRAAREEYQRLFSGFRDGLKTLLHKDVNLALWLDHFDSLLMRFSACIPAARAGSTVPDVSLYDHSRTTAALATALYAYHRDTDTLSVEAVREKATRKLLLINGNFLGIQTFIFGEYGESQRYRSKILRGRSFMVSLMSDLAAEMLCHRIGLPSLSVILNAAGQFTLLAPNTDETRQAMSAVTDKINDWLISIAYGQTVITFNAIPASCDDFISGEFRKLWDEKGRQNDVQKLSRIDLDRYGGVVAGYLDRFNTDLKHTLCPICGKRPSDPAMETARYVRDAESSCRLCRDQVFLGTNLVKKRRLAIHTGGADVSGKHNSLAAPLFGRYQVTFPDDPLDALAADGKLVKYWDLGLTQQGEMATDAAMRLINGYVPRYTETDRHDDRITESVKEQERETLDQQIRDGDPMSLNHIARRAMNPADTRSNYEGVAALGVLKADVDRLGALMSCGLADKRFTVSRLATLSRQLNDYFAVYLPHFLMTHQAFKDVYTVFAGGDDLFLIGPWNRAAELATALRKSFSDYVCRNPEIHFSAGITVHKSHTPVDHMAEAAESALKTAKIRGRNRISHFQETVTWDALEGLMDIREELARWMKDGTVNRAMLYRLNVLMDLARQEGIVVKGKSVDIRDMACTKWRSMLAYTTGRNVGRDLKGEVKDETVARITARLADWINDHRGAMRIPVWDILYNIRRS